MRLIVLFIIFFFLSLLTNMTGPLIPEVIHSFKLSLTLAALLPFSFFIAYAFMSIPSGVMIETWGEKPMMLGAFALSFAGSLLFCLVPLYSTAIISLFLIGLGMAALQVAINPLLRVTGGEEHFAFNAVMAQLVFGLASFASPLLYSHFTRQLNGTKGSIRDGFSQLLARVVPSELPWIAIYWIFSMLALAMILLISTVHFPPVKRTTDEQSGALGIHLDLLSQKVVWLYLLGIFSYVGLEQGLTNWMSQFLVTLHGFNPQTDGATAVAGFWGLMTIGCVLGLFLLKFFDSRKVLAWFSSAALLTVTFAIFGTRNLAIYAFPCCGLAISVMWSIIFSLALNSLPKNHGTFSGILCTGIAGGAIVPVFIGLMGDTFGMRAGLCVIYFPLLYIFAMALWARPLIKNQTLSLARLQ